MDGMRSRVPRVAGGGLALAFVVALCLACRTEHPLTAAETPTRAAEISTLRIVSVPKGASLTVNGRPTGQTPAGLQLAPGQVRVELAMAGYAPWAEDLTLAPGGTLTVSASLADVAPPAAHLESLPRELEQGEQQLVRASATDNEGVVSLVLSIDGVEQAGGPGGTLDYRWDTATAAPGAHVLHLEARDRAGNVGQAEASLTLLAAATPTAPVPTRPPVRAVSIRRGSLTVSTYGYLQALHSDPASAAYPYPVLDRSRVGPLSPVSYQTVVLENEYLRLVFLPALGGRLYQCTFLPTGQNLFYNNPVLKPSNWGPPEMGWWLAAGGMEWCLPVEEHGYVTAESWDAATASLADGSARITLSHTERTHNIQATVAVTLRPGRASFAVSTRLANPDGQAKAYQYWSNAMLSLGSASLSPQTRFVLPASEVVVHSTGDPSLGSPHSTLPWPMVGGRDLSRYANWRNWLGVFAPQATAGYLGAYSEDSDLGIARIFPLQQVPGVKLFAFGRDYPDRGTYTDDGSQYVELWGGVTRTFWDQATLGPGGSVEWTETWLPFHGLGGLSGATAEAAVLADWDGQQMRLGVATPQARNLTVVVSDDAGEVYRQACASSPRQPYVAAVRPSRALSGSPIMRVLGEDGSSLAEHVVGPR